MAATVASCLPVFSSVDLFCRMAAAVRGRRRRELAFAVFSCARPGADEEGSVRRGRGQHFSAGVRSKQ